MKDSKHPISLEDLLRLKRAERPPVEFWDEFDRQLRAKQLAALVAKRPWWQGMRWRLVGPSRFYFPLGATVVVAVTLFSLRQTPSDQPANGIEVAPPAVAQSELAPVSTDSVASVTVRPRESDNRLASTAAVIPSVPMTPSPTIARIKEEATVTRVQVGALPLGALTTVVGGAAEIEPITPSARFIAANLAAAQDTIPTTLLTEALGFESRAMPARVAVEPLQQMTPPGEARRSTRFLAAMVSQSVSDTALRTAERMANRISVEELYDQPNRFGTRRGGVNMKF